MTEPRQFLGEVPDKPEEMIRLLKTMPIEDIALDLVKIATNTVAGATYERFREPAAMIVQERLTNLQVATMRDLSETAGKLTTVGLGLALVQAFAAGVALWTFFHR